ncbi:MAG: hypothetical protein P9L92_08385 [Candidatus Electryonea clarkiae]|nr:hypothetical protein [Candidatus Electryonea clarkiae]MDP8288241.1 hypothetical protein [Candidatus Electryonea clarkiae]
MTWNPFKKKSLNIVIVCMANITRSPYFAQLLQRTLAEKPLHLSGEISVTSAGVDAFNGAGPNQVISAIADTRGIPFYRHRSRRFDRYIASRADLILTMENAHKEKILKNFPKLEGKVFTVLEFGRKPGDLKSFDVPDPTGLELKEYQDFIDAMEQEVDRVRNILSIHGLP